MSAMTYIIIANAAVVAGIGGYLAYLFVSGTTLQKRLRQLELLEDGNE